MARARTQRRHGFTSAQPLKTGDGDVERLRSELERKVAELEAAIDAVKKQVVVVDAGLIVDHGALLGLNDDDHPQYTTLAEVTAVKLDDFAAPDDNTDLNASTTRHGLLPKLDNDATHFLDGQGNWSSAVASDVIAEIDFSDEVDTDLTTGDHAIGGLTWTAAKNAATLFELDEGSGLHYDADGTSTAFTSTTQTAAYIDIALGDIYTAYDIDASTPLIFEIYISSITFPSNGCRVLLGIYGASGVPVNAGSRLIGVSRAKSGGVDVLTNIQGTSTSSNYTTDAAATNVVGLYSIGGGFSSVPLAGVWDAGWPPLDKQIFAFGAEGGSPARDKLSRLVIAFPTGSTAGDMDAVVERLRIRRAA